ncbi:MAG: hypothetical protein HRT44_07035 [Bdellovibrionales bacterium]|nr:hypothetical protein [Bdellovibrionales bacterium]NQZ18992.1 hypothetical protein [Bdellovibrionales bacterium]
MSQISRRNLMRMGLGAAGTLVAQKAMAATCEPAASTAEQPLGPFFPREGTPQHPVKEIKDDNLPIYLANDNDLTYVQDLNENAKGQVAHINGQLTSSDCTPIANATIIIWQASESGRYNHMGDSENSSFAHPITGEIIDRELDKNFQYWGKTRTDAQGNYNFKTIVPGFYPANLQSGWYRPPHIHFLIMATGFENLVTQMYFRGKDIENNDFIQDLNEVDFLLHNPNMTDLDKEALTVDFEKMSSESDEIEGRFDIQLP